MLLCSLCKKNHIELDEDGNGKMYCLSVLFIKCTGKKGKFFEKFYSSLKVGTCQAFEVNCRIALASRNFGVGHQGFVKFAAVMNTPPPMNENSYRGSVDAVTKAAQTICQQSMRSADENVKNFYESDEDEAFDIGISGDDTWTPRGYSSIFE